jgi:hypothetical protein
MIGIMNLVKNLMMDAMCTEYTYRVENGMKINIF